MGGRSKPSFLSARAEGAHLQFSLAEGQCLRISDARQGDLHTSLPPLSFRRAVLAREGCRGAGLTSLRPAGSFVPLFLRELLARRLRMRGGMHARCAGKSGSTLAGIRMVSDPHGRGWGSIISDL